MTIWTIGGLDPSGGAGVLRDIWTIESMDPQQAVHALLSAWTWQGDGNPARAQAMNGRRFLEVSRTLARPTVVKLGLIPTEMVDVIMKVCDEVASAQQSKPPIIVFDPVWKPSDGGDLGVEARALLPLIARAHVLTPNLEEAQWLLEAAGMRAAKNPKATESPLDRSGKSAMISPELKGEPRRMDELAIALASHFPGVAILVKGGHCREFKPGGLVSDVLWERGQLHRFERGRWIESESPRGTGCALASAIALGLANGSCVYDAVAMAIAWLDQARRYTWAGSDGRPQLLVPSHTCIWGGSNSTMSG